MVMNLLFQIQLHLVQRPTVEEFNSKKNYDLSFTAFFGSSHEAIKNFENVIPKIYFDNNIVHKISMIEKTICKLHQVINNFRNHFYERGRSI